MDGLGFTLAGLAGLAVCSLSHKGQETKGRLQPGCASGNPDATFLTLLPTGCVQSLF